MKWYSKYLPVYNKPYDRNNYMEITNSIKNRIKQNYSNKPIVTLSVIAYNEERNLLSCLWSLCNQNSKYTFEIIGVNNNSTDKTQQIFDDCGITTFIEYHHSCGYARQCGLSNAKGKYHLNIDSDTIYPQLYVQKMVENLEKNGVVGVCSLWSYIPDKNHSSIFLMFYEFCRDLYLYIQSIRRPELSVRGLVFGYNTELARKIGIRTDIIRGEDGSLALELKKYGKIRFLKNRNIRAVTGYGTMDKDGSIFNAFKGRVIKVFREYKKLFSSASHYKDEESNLTKNDYDKN